MPNKLSDNEIVKALEESISFDEPYESNFTLIRIEYIKNTLDLINRQKEEKDVMQHYIDHLQAEFDKNENIIRLADKTITTQQAENEKLQEAIDEQDVEIAQLYKRIDKAKAEARKEFADLSIKRICEQVSAPTPSESYIVERCNQEIDNLLKEMESEEIEPE